MYSVSSQLLLIYSTWYKRLFLECHYVNIFRGLSGWQCPFSVVHVLFSPRNHLWFPLKDMVQPHLLYFCGWKQQGFLAVKMIEFGNSFSHDPQEDFPFYEKYGWKIVYFPWYYRKLENLSALMIHDKFAKLQYLDCKVGQHSCERSSWGGCMCVYLCACECVWDRGRERKRERCRIFAMCVCEQFYNCLISIDIFCKTATSNSISMWNIIWWTHRWSSMRGLVRRYQVILNKAVFSLLF